MRKDRQALIIASAMALSLAVPASVWAQSKTLPKSAAAPATQPVQQSPAPVAAAAEAEAVTAAPEHIFPIAGEQTGSGVLVDRDAYLRERGWSLGFHQDNPSGAYLGWGRADILTRPTSPEYGMARTSAVDAAVAEAMGQFALSMGTQATAELVRRITRDPNALQRQIATSQSDFARAVNDRVMNLTTAQLDAALAELGVDPSEHQQMDFRQKAILMEERVTASTLRSAVQAFSGVRLLKTFEEQGAVGALVIYNPRFAEIAQAIVADDLAAVGTGVSSDIVAQVADSLSDEDLLFMHGVRLWRDAEGNPVIVAFGQQSPPVTRADSQRVINMSITAAERGASLNADRAIAEFLGAQVAVDDDQVVDALSQVSATATGQGVTQTEGAMFTQTLNSLIRQRSQLDLSGITEIRSWRANHPDTGHLYVGTVKMWSPTTQAAFLGRPRVEQAPAAPQTTAKPDVGVQRRSSAEFGTEDW